MESYWHGTRKIPIIKRPTVISFPEAATNLKEEIDTFPTNAWKFTSKKVADQAIQKKYECPDLTCTEEFERKHELELHLNVYGHHTVSKNVKESLYTTRLGQTWFIVFKRFLIMMKRHQVLKSSKHARKR